MKRNWIAAGLALAVGASCTKKNTEAVTTPAPATGACAHAVTPKGARTLGYDILDTTQTGSFNDNMTKARGMGLGFIQIHLYWNALEIDTDGVAGAPYTMGFTDPGSALASMNAVAKANGVKLSLIISPIDIPARPVPADLQAAGTKFNSATMSNRFNALVDYLFAGGTPRVDPTIMAALSVGNEIDGYNWAGNGDTQAEYSAFLAAIKTKVNSYGVKLNFTTSLHGMLNGGTTYSGMATSVDGVSITYYPQTAGFIVQDPSVVFDDLDKITAKLPGVPILLQEVGYQSSGVSGSSEAMQATFFCNFFKAWDTHAAAIPYASILRMNDVSLASAQTTAVNYGLTGNQQFIEYIRTLGIRSHDGTGTDKAAVAVIKEEAAERGW